jgi:antitoxin (DNA-binding transcriptional repressor) of toxin-antitoxin stability system
MQVSLTEAAASLNDLVQAAIDGEEVISIIGDRPAIKFTPIESVKPRPKFGSAKGLVWMSDDFDEPLAEMKEHTYLVPIVYFRSIQFKECGNRGYMPSLLSVDCIKL